MSRRSTFRTNVPLPSSFTVRAPIWRPIPQSPITVSAVTDDVTVAACNTIASAGRATLDVPGRLAGISSDCMSSSDLLLSAWPKQSRHSRHFECQASIQSSLPCAPHMAAPNPRCSAAEAWHEACRSCFLCTSI